MATSGSSNEAHEIQYGHRTFLVPPKMPLPGTDPRANAKAEDIRVATPLGAADALTSSLTLLHPSREQVEETLRTHKKPQPMNSLVASAAKLTRAKASDASYRKSIAQDWHHDGWAMYDLVGEMRFLTDTISSRTAKAHIYVGEVKGQADNPIKTEKKELIELLDSIGGGPAGLQQIIERLVANLKVPGEGWVVGVPNEMIEAWEDEDVTEVESMASGNAPRGSATRRASNAPARAPQPGRTSKPGQAPTPRATVKRVDREQVREAVQKADTAEEGGVNLEDYEWFTLSVSELEFQNDGRVALKMGPADDDQKLVDPDDLQLIRVHKPHPRYFWQADSPTRSALPILRELVGLTMHVSAQIDSRLAGAGVFIVPESYSKAVKRAMGLPDDSPDDPVTDGLMTAMLTPISDRSAASAFVPLVLTVPDDAADKFRHITFDKGLDTQAQTMRTESIRRYALSSDAPPELLLGSAGMNHWGMWLSREDVVRAHLEPNLALICDAFTTQFLRPLIKENFPELDPDDYVIWYDVEHLIIRASLGQDAKELYDRDELNGESLRRANGFDESNAPQKAEVNQQAVDAVFEMVKQNPGLMRRPGLDVLVKQMVALLNGSPLGADDMVIQAAEAQETAEDVEQETGVDVESTGASAGAPAAQEAAPEASNSGPTEAAGPTDSAPPGLGLLPAQQSVGLVIHDAREFGDIRGSLSKLHARQEAAPPQAAAAQANPGLQHVMGQIVGQVATGNYGPIAEPDDPDVIDLTDLSNYEGV